MKSFPLTLLLIIYSNNLYAITEGLQEIKICYEDVSVDPWITGDMKGIVIQQLQMVEKIANVKFNYIRLPWKRCQIEAQKGKIDGLIAASYSKRRTLWGVYPTYKNGNINRNQRLHTDSFVIFKTKNSPITFENGKLLNLETHKIGVQLGYSVGNDLEEQGYPTFSSFSTARDIIMALDKNVINVAILQNYSTLKVLAEHPKLERNIIPLQPPFKIADQYLLFTKTFYFNNKKISDQIWNSIPTARESGEYKKILAEY